MGAEGTRVVDEDVEAPEPVDDLVHGAPDLLGPPDVRPDDHRAAPERPTAPGRLLGAGQIRVAEHRHVGARLGERDRLGAADPGGASRHERHPRRLAHRARG